MKPMIPKDKKIKIYTIVKGRETFYRRNTVPVTSCSEVKFGLKRISLGSKDCTKELKLECAYFLGQMPIYVLEAMSLLSAYEVLAEEIVYCLAEPV